MKYYFIVIIVVLSVVIFLLFFILYKIYKLHTRTVDELTLAEQQELLSNFSDSGSKGSSAELSVNSDPPFLYNGNDVNDGDVIGGLLPPDVLDVGDAVHGQQEVDVTTVQPDLKELTSSGTSLEKPTKHETCCRQSLKYKPRLKMQLQYDKSKQLLTTTIKHIEGKIRSKVGSSETYIDVQVSAYRFRTYRTPGYRRPAKTIFKKAIEFHLDHFEMKTAYLLVFLLRYDPFSRLKVDGEVVVKLSDIVTQGFLDGVQSEFSKEIMKSSQEFTAFIYRPS